MLYLKNCIIAFLLTGNLNLSYEDNVLLFEAVHKYFKDTTPLVRNFVFMMFYAHIIIFLQVQKRFSVSFGSTRRCRGVERHEHQ